MPVIEQAFCKVLLRFKVFLVSIIHRVHAICRRRIRKCQAGSPAWLLDLAALEAASPGGVAVVLALVVVTSGRIVVVAATVAAAAAATMLAVSLLHSACAIFIG